MFKVYLYFVLAFMSIFVYVLVRGLHRAWRTYFWIETEGVINEAKLLNLGLVSTSGASGANILKYGASIQYEYQVNGETFQSKRVSFFEMLTSTSKRKINKILSRYSVETPIKVYYNPEEPSEAVLEQGLDIKAFFSCTCLSILIGGIVYAIILEG